jgi:hypothetical protein
VAQDADGRGQAASGVQCRGAGSSMQEASGSAVGVDVEGGGENEGHCKGARQPQKGQVCLLSLISLLLNLSIVV